MWMCTEAFQCCFSPPRALRVCGALIDPPVQALEAEAREKLLRKHVTRNSTQRIIVVRETPKMYEEAHERYISSIPREATAWVRKILSLEKEKERLLHVDDEFLLNTDPKWTTHPECATTARETWMGHPSVVDLYCLAIAMDENLRSLRDVRARHLPALRAMPEMTLPSV